MAETEERVVHCGQVLRKKSLEGSTAVFLKEHDFSIPVPGLKVVVVTSDSPGGKGEQAYCNGKLKIKIREEDNRIIYNAEIVIDSVQT